MKLNIQWPEKDKGCIHNGKDEYSCDECSQRNEIIDLCIQAVEKAIKDAEKDVPPFDNENIVLENKPCDVCGKIHTQFPPSCRPSTKISFYGKIKDTEKEINRQEYIKAGEENLSKHGAVIESGIAQAFLNASLHNYKDGDKCATPKD